jgi:hypothetical protein
MANKASSSGKTVRKSVSLPPELASKVRLIAESKRLSDNQVLVGLLEEAMAGRERERKRFFELTEMLIKATNEKQREAIKEELARMTFGE